MITQQIVHYFLHFVLPFFIAKVFYKEKWVFVYGIFLLTMLVDLDHLLADPIFDPNRCSIQFHPLHSVPAIIGYGALILFKRTRVLGIGFLMHMLTDLIDCWF